MITVITAWYNEEYLAPFFLRHYSFADNIIILLDTATNDRSEEIATSFKNVAGIYPLHFPEGMDEKRKVLELNREYAKVDYGYVINADADEFVFCDTVDFDEDWDTARVELNNVYRNVSDTDLDPSLPVMGQRKHGTPAWPYRKPIVVKAGLPLEWTVGNHQIKINGKKEPYYDHGLDSRVKYRAENLKGVHWANADPCFCVERRLLSQARQSKLNLAKGYSKHNHGITKNDVLKECRQHEHDPVII